MKKLIVLVLLIVLSWAPLAAEIPYTAHGGYKHTLRPFTGGWINTTGLAANTGFFVDVTPLNGRDFAFVTYFTYTPSGTQYWFATQGFVEYSTESARRTTGIAARLVADVYSAIGGTCWGCPFQRATISSLGSMGEMVFFTPVAGEFRWNGSTLPITAAPETRNWDYAGYYHLMARSYYADVSQVYAHIVTTQLIRLVPEIERNYHIKPGMTDSAFRPAPPGARLYKMVCISNCTNGFAGGTNNPLLNNVVWFDAQGNGGMFNWQGVNAQLFPTPFQIIPSPESTTTGWADTHLIGGATQIFIRNRQLPDSYFSLNRDAYAEGLMTRLPPGYYPEQQD